MTVRRELEDALKIDKNDLDEELIRQPELFYQVAKAAVEASALRDKAKRDVEVAAAEFDADHRDDASAKNEKITETGLVKLIEADPRMKRMKATYGSARDEAERWLALKEAWQMRAYALKDLTSIYNANYYSTESGSKARGDAKDIIADRNRREAGEKRMAAGAVSGRVKRGAPE